MAENSNRHVVRFAIVGGGWRTEAFLRVARELPDRFTVAGMQVRREERGRELEKQFGVQTFRTLDELLEDANFDFALVSVPWEVCPVLIAELAGRNVAVLSETPPAPDVEGLDSLLELARNGSKIQVAEQYWCQPLHAARLEVVHAGLIGRVSQAQVSACHGYHGVSLIRRLLGVGFEECTISARRFTSPLIATINRAGEIPAEGSRVDSTQTIAHLEFAGNKLGVYDFAGEQYFSWIRAPRILVRGDLGEIQNDTVKFQTSTDRHFEFTLERVNAGELGNLEGHQLAGYVAADRWYYRNSFAPGRLNDDEIAVAHILEGMGAYVRGGEEIYSLAEAAQDRYLDILIAEAADTGKTVTSTRRFEK